MSDEDMVFDEIWYNSSVIRDMRSRWTKQML